MDKTKLLEELEETFKEKAESISDELVQLYLDNVEREEKVLFDTIIKTLKKGIEASNGGFKDKIKYIHGSFLRVKLLEGKFIYKFEAFDKNGYFDLVDTSEDYDATWIYSPLKRIWEELNQEVKKYTGKLDFTDVQNLIMEEMIGFNGYIVHLAKETMEKFDIKEYIEQDYELDLEIRIGEYRGFDEAIFTTDETEELN